MILVWGLKRKIYIWDVEKEELLLELNGHKHLSDLRISGDGSRIFSLHGYYIYAWSVQTGEVVGKVAAKHSRYTGSLTIDGSKVWACYQSNSEYQGWDFRIPGSSPVKLSNAPPLANGSMLWDPRQTRIKNAVTGEEIGRAHV